MSIKELNEAYKQDKISEAEYYYQLARMYGVITI